MDTLSALIDGGFQIGGHVLGQYFNKKNMRDQAQLQYKYAESYAKNSPSWNVQGLRDAGLNPILAVSNGVNFGANIPNITNSSPDGKINTKFTEALGRMNDRAVNQQNADSNTEVAESQSTSADADMIRAKADAALKQAQTAETLQRTKFEGQGKGYKNDVVNDLVRGSTQISETVPEFIKQADQYLQHSPSKPAAPVKSDQTSYDRKMEKLYKENQRSKRMRRFERYEEKNKNTPNLRSFILR